MSRILIVEDDTVIRSALSKLLERNKYQVAVATSVKEVSNQDLSIYSLIISELRLPGAPGTDLIALAKEVPVLIMTGSVSLRSAIDSMRLGAADYIAKPFDNDTMMNAVRQAIGKAREPVKLKSPSEFAGMIGNSAAMCEIYQRIQKVAPTAATVLIRGETGTGKELVAKAIHQESDRSHKPLISVNCAAIPETLIESELFGHEKGAFTGAAASREGLVAAADGGTLFLDEIGELPLEAQARLLRVLQEGEVRPVGSVSSRKVDVRLISATHRNLAMLAKEGSFREDLFYRINVVELSLPPLRERGKDIDILANSLLKKYCQSYQKPGLQLAPEANELLNKYPWPGNIREMQNAIQRAVILCDKGRRIDSSLLALDTTSDNDNPFHQSLASRSAAPFTLDSDQNLSLEDYFQRFVLENQDTMSETELARKLGVSRKCLWERRQRLGIPRKRIGN